MRWAMPQPCMGSRAMVLRIRRSNVPCTKSVGLLIHPPQLSTVRYMLAPPLVNSQGGIFRSPKEVPMFGRMTATPLIRLDAGQSLEVAVAELLVATDYPQVARWIQFPTAAVLLLALTQQAWVSTSRSKRHCSLMTWDDRASGACD